MLLSGTLLLLSLMQKMSNVPQELRDQVREGLGGWEALEPSAMRTLHIYATD